MPFTPQFPTFEKWQSMTEGEQDALLARMESARRRRSLSLRFLVGLGFAAVAVSILKVLL